MRLALESLHVVPLLLLSHWRVAIAGVKNAVRCRRAMMADLRVVVNMAGEWVAAGSDVRFG